MVEGDREVPVRRTTISPSRTTARGATRPMLRIATSGWFTIGVWKRPASLPALDTVNVEPRRSSARERARASALGERRDLRVRARRRTSRSPPRTTGTTRPSSRLHRDPDVVAVEVEDRVAVEAARSARGTRRASRRTPSRPSGGGARAERPRSRTPRPRSRAAPRDAPGSCARRSRGGRRASGSRRPSALGARADAARRPP